MRIQQTPVYQYDELSDKAKERAREWFLKDYPDHEWWDFIYEDAERIGLKITEFDLGNRKYINGYLTVSVEECCKKIIAEHGKDCETYKLVERWEFAPDAEENEEDEKEAEARIFTDTLLEKYFSMLAEEYDYLVSDEQVEESIRANEYEFTEEGEWI